MVRKCISGSMPALIACLCTAGVFILLAGIAEHQQPRRIALAIALCLPAIFVLLRRFMLIEGGR
jgi:type III secretory pathway component EscT